ncbi:hypothetical protein PIB30_045019 [Stylosanthes scabra]|uniref:Secreted protein n=1 Tax=Stylosanthes scabra TaxID=79078 RepID=A0ABU6QGA0_9FABA|nr:hypothetical protein [Stylosanthes scabra]
MLGGGAMPVTLGFISSLFLLYRFRRTLFTSCSISFCFRPLPFSKVRLGAQDLLFSDDKRLDKYELCNQT